MNKNFDVLPEEDSKTASRVTRSPDSYTYDTYTEDYVSPLVSEYSATSTMASGKPFILDILKYLLSSVAGESDVQSEKPEEEEEEEETKEETTEMKDITSEHSSISEIIEIISSFDVEKKTEFPSTPEVSKVTFYAEEPSSLEVDLLAESQVLPEVSIAEESSAVVEESTVVEVIEEGEEVEEKYLEEFSEATKISDWKDYDVPVTLDMSTFGEAEEKLLSDNKQSSVLSEFLSSETSKPHKLDFKLSLDEMVKDE